MKDQKYFSLTKIISKHLNEEKQTEIGNLKRLYLSYFVDFYSNINLFQSSIDILSYLFADLNYFMKLFRNSIILFYNLNYYSNYYKIKYLNLNNIKNFNCCELFSKEIYDICFFFLRHFYKTIEEKLQKKFEISLNKKISDFRIQIFFQLNEKTLEYFNIKSTNENLLTKNPYQEAIETLKNIQFQQNPIHKMKILYSVKESIEKTIYSFYVKFNMEIPKIPSEEQYNLLIYVVSQSKIATLYVHLQIIGRFLKNISLNNEYTSIYFAFNDIIKYFINFNFNFDNKVLNENIFDSIDNCEGKKFFE